MSASAMSMEKTKCNLFTSTHPNLVEPILHPTLSCKYKLSLVNSGLI